MRSRKIAVFIAGLLVALFSISAIPVDRLRTHVTWLAAPAREGRRAGQAGAAAAAAYISDQFKQIGFDVHMQEFGANRRNVVARYGKAAKYIVVGAHYDGQGPGFPSASDNGSGVSVLIELSRELKTANLPVSLVMVAFDDEEQGFTGSRYYVDHPPWPLDNAVAAVVFDTLGRPFIDLQSWTLFVLGTEYSEGLANVVGRQTRNDMLVAGTDLIGPRSDFAPFAVKKIPYLFFSDGTHKDYHGQGDTADRVNYARLAEDATRIGGVIREIAQLKIRPKFRETAVYPPAEVDALLRIMSAVRAEKPDLPAAYRLIFADMEQRIKVDKSRDTLRVAASAMLGLATPAFSPYMLDYVVEPFYDSLSKLEIVTAVREESARWSK